MSEFQAGDKVLIDGKNPAEVVHDNGTDRVYIVESGLTRRVLRRRLRVASDGMDDDPPAPEQAATPHVTLQSDDKVSPDGRVTVDVFQQPSATSHQVGGDHYRDLAIQPVEYIHRNGLGFVEGSVVKYVTRWRKKNGVEDLLKARHFLNLLIEMETRTTPE